MGAAPQAALARPAPGERTISNAEVPLPRSPLSLAAGTANRKAVLSVLRRVGDSEGTPLPARDTPPCSSAARVQPRGCKGRSPLHEKKPWSPPSPPGKGVGGIGGRKVNQRQGWQARRKASPPAGAEMAGAAGGKEGKPPRGAANTHRAGEGWGKPPPPVPDLPR